MATELITITEYCVSYHIEPNFITALEESGIITFTIIDTEKYIHLEQLNELDRYIHLHYDLNINMEGIDAIRHLLNKVDRMQNEINQLKNHLHLHE